MRTIKFSDLDASQQRLVFRLADEAETLTPTILAAVSHIGELWEAWAFLTHFRRGAVQHERLTSRLQLGDTSTESVPAAIKRIAPTYRTLEQRSDAKLDEILSSLENASLVGACTYATVKKMRPKPRRQKDEEFFVAPDDDFLQGLMLALEATLEAPVK